MRAAYLHSLVLVILLFVSSERISRAQFIDGTSGLLQMPSAEMERSGTFTITNNFLHQYTIPAKWYYNTFGYSIGITFWSRLEVSYVCTLVQGEARNPDYWPEYTWGRFVNQDRHFAAKILLLREGEIWAGMPGLAVGISDPVTGQWFGDYLSGDVSGEGNGYFNRTYVVMSKHFKTKIGEFGGHLGYQYNRRLDYYLNAPCAGITWEPIWVQDKWLENRLRLVLEYDSRTVNMGIIASLFHRHFDFMIELNSFRYINAGLRYKIVL